MLSILIVDNNDSFTYNLVEVLRETKLCIVKVCLLENIQSININNYDGIILSPGPGLPEEKKGLFELINSLQEKPLLGVCLGHQAIAKYFGAEIYQLNSIIHGEASSIEISNQQPLDKPARSEMNKNFHNRYKHRDIKPTGGNKHKIFKDLPSIINVGRYHSWAVIESTLPQCFEIGSKTDDNIIMSIKHKTKNINSVQFHPESILTPLGSKILINWLTYCIAQK